MSLSGGPVAGCACLFTEGCCEQFLPVVPWDAFSTYSREKDRKTKLCSDHSALSGLNNGGPSRPQAYVGSPQWFDQVSLFCFGE